MCWCDYRFVLVIFILLHIGGCSASPNKPGNRSDIATHTATASLSSPDKVTKLLYTQFNHWKGTRYRFGGLSKKGIDCSGFVQITFKSRFGIRLPRNTQLQSQIGLKIPKTKLRAGDLVFFKTNKRTNHVGIYIEAGKFMHVSTKKGVIISRLNNVYWKPRFWMARRLTTLPDPPY